MLFVTFQFDSLTRMSVLFLDTGAVHPGDLLMSVLLSASSCEINVLVTSEIDVVRSHKICAPDGSHSYLAVPRETFNARRKGHEGEERGLRLLRERNMRPISSSYISSPSYF